MIKCPNCEKLNNVQKHCGFCGELLLADGAEIRPSATEKDDAPTRAKKRMRPWVKGLLAFLAIYLIGGVLLQIIVTFSGSTLDEKFIGGISFFAGIIAFIGIIFNGHNNKSVVDEINNAHE